MATRLIIGVLLACCSAPSMADKLARHGEDPIAYYQYIASVHQWLGVPRSVVEETRLVLQREAAELVPVGRDRFGRTHYLAPEAAAAWHRLRLAAGEAGIEFVMVSSFRSAEYQARLARRHMEGGRVPELLFRAIALPGYSEHHTGCALDLASEDLPTLAHEFRDSPAYAWLREHAADFGFRESYPPGNRKGIMPEPWHWFYTQCKASLDGDRAASP